jgi:two-component system chemotaxis response regulator CheB
MSHQTLQPGAARSGLNPGGTTPPDENQVRVLVVDDSAFMRFTISKRLSETPGLTVVGTAHDGREALDLIPKLQPDVVTLDVEMPRLDGLSTLREIMTNFPRPVIMVSSLTTEGANETIQALTLGAVDFIAKPSSKANIESITDEIATKIKRAVRARVYALPRSGRRPDAPLATSLPLPLAPATPPGMKRTRPLRSGDRVVVIGSSTGGPRALNTVVPLLSADLPAALVIIQHMPVGFTHSLAERLDSLSQFAIKEAAPGDRLEVGRGLLAPGGFHMTFDAHGAAVMNQNPPVHGVRPAVDVTMTSIAQHFGASVVAAILTGMGNDGTNGAALVHGTGGFVIAEHESTCVVYGMPRSVVEAGAADQIIPLNDIAAAIERAVRR